MTSIFDAFKRQPRAAGTPPTALTVKVTRYEISGSDPLKHYVEGVDLLTEKTVRVALRADDESASRNKARPEINDFATGKGIHGKKTMVAPGGVMRFDGSWAGRDQTVPDVTTYTASWPNALSHNETEASIFVRATRVIPRPGDAAKDKNPSVLVDMLSSDASVIVKTAADLKKNVFEAMGKSSPQNRAVYVRVVANDGSERGAVFLSAQQRRSVDKESGEVTYNLLSPQDAFSEAQTNQFIGPKLNAIMAALDAPNDYKVEVIPAFRLSIGRDTVEAMVDKGRFDKVDKAWRVQLDEKTVESGFRMSSVALRVGDQGKMFVTHVAAVGGDQPLFKMQDVPSPNFVGVAYERPQEGKPTSDSELDASDFSPR